MLLEFDYFFENSKDSVNILQIALNFFGFLACFEGFLNIEKIVIFGQNDKDVPLMILAKIDNFLKISKTVQTCSKWLQMFIKTNVFGFFSIFRKFFKS